MPISSGQILHDHYQIQSLLGQGGMGAVYRALHMSLNRVCAIKENLDTSPSAQEQFLREAQILGQLRHPHLPQVYEYFIEPNGRQYLVMEFIAGEDLQSIVQRGEPLSEPQVSTWMSQVLDALIYLHTRVPPIIHRDIKPANIRIMPEGRAMLVDFGIAKVWTTGQLTTPGARAITPGYSPPEQYGQGPTDARSDIYALGATLYFVLTKTPPVEAVERLSGISLKLPSMLNPALSPAIERLILRAMDMNPQNRFQTAQELRRALETLPAAAPEHLAPDAARYMKTAPVSSTMPASLPAAAPVAVPAVPKVARPRSSNYWLAPVVAGNVLSLVLNMGAAAANQGLSSDVLIVLLFFLCGFFLLVPFAMGFWGARRENRIRGSLTAAQAVRAGAWVGALSSAANLVLGLIFMFMLLGRSAMLLNLVGILLVSVIGVVVYVGAGAAGGAVSRAGPKN